MNESGRVLRKLVQHFKINPVSELLVVVDDVNLPFGRLRIRPGGSDGGHRGLRSIEAHLGTQDYGRLRIGIGPGNAINIPLEEYVLGSFTPEEEQRLAFLFQEAGRACLLWLSQPMEKVMNEVNKP